MATRPTRSRPYVGQRVWLGGDITVVIDTITGFKRVTIKLDKYEHPVTIIWSEPDDRSIVVTDE